MIASSSPRTAPLSASGTVRTPYAARLLVYLVVMSAGCLLLGKQTASAAEASPPPPVAIALAVTGEIQARLPDIEEAVPVRPLAWFPEGTELITSEGASLELVFRSGARWRFIGEAGARLEAEKPTETRGTIEQLTDLPATPAIAPVDTGEVARATLTAVRIRGQGFSLLYPDGGARAVAGATRLFFQPDLPFERYRVEVEDEEGRLLLDLETRENLVEVPPGVLEPGTTYYWRVRTRDALGHLLWEEARFETLSAVIEERRVALHLAAGELEAPAMLAAVDQELGLWWEARAALEEGLRRDPGDPHLTAALERLRGSLGWGDGELVAKP